MAKLPKLLLVIALLVVTSCAPPPVASPQADLPTATAAATDLPAKSVDLTVFAAASLTDAFTEIGQAFDATHPEVNTVFNFGGSQNLRTQLEQGAQADIFASANQKEMDAAIASGLVVSGTEQVFLNNHLIVILPAVNPGAIQSLEDLARPGLKLVLAAEEVPVGNYARQALENSTPPTAGTTNRPCWRTSYRMKTTSSRSWPRCSSARPTQASSIHPMPSLHPISRR